MYREYQQSGDGRWIVEIQGQKCPSCFNDKAYGLEARFSDVSVFCCDECNTPFFYCYSINTSDCYKDQIGKAIDTSSV